MFFNLSGFQIAVLIILAFAVILLAIHLLHPKSAVARVEDKAFNYIERDAGDALRQWRSDFTKAGGFFANEEAAIAAGWQKIVPTFEGELQKLLTSAESHIIDTSSEDQDIADAHDTISKANDKRAAKFALGRAHLARVQAALDEKDPPNAPQPAAAPTV